MKKLFIFILTSVIIGNAMAWMMGAWPITFELQPYDGEEKMTLAGLTDELKDNPDEVDLLVELGSIYSLHNEIDKAAVHLDKAIALAPENPAALAWYSANAAKLSGASLDFTWGMYKLYTLAEALAGISQAVDMAPDDLTIRLVRLATFANTGTINSQFHLVFDDEAWFINLIKQYPDDIPEQIKGQVYLSMAQAYFFKADENAGEKVQHYLDLYQSMPNKPAAEQRHFDTLTASFAAADRGQAWK